MGMARYIPTGDNAPNLVSALSEQDVNRGIDGTRGRPDSASSSDGVGQVWNRMLQQLENLNRSNEKIVSASYR
jgi:hypothetical protein